MIVLSSKKYIRYILAKTPIILIFLNWIISRRFFRDVFGNRLDKDTQTRLNKVFSNNLGDGRSGDVMFIGGNWLEAVLLQSFILKSFEAAGFNPIVIGGETKLWLYRMLGIRKHTSLYGNSPLNRKRQAKKLLSNISNESDLLQITWKGIRCGRYTASTAIRELRVGTLDLKDPKTINVLEIILENSLILAEGSQEILDKVSPKAAVFTDRGYSGEGELFEACLNREVPCYTFNAGYKNDILILKRYTGENQDTHPTSLSKSSWQKLIDMNWDLSLSKKLKTELENIYETGQWYPSAGTQIGKQKRNLSELRDSLSLNPDKKTAVIFSHVLWDATFFWGNDLFANYEEWFVETIKLACQNTNINWLIKIHPANVIKNSRDGVKSEISELTSIKQHIGKLPNHVKIIDADTNISTWSLYEIMDYCLTVRGTVGIESALLGKIVLTAGTGRYDRLGFTVDCDTRDEYINTIKNLENLNSSREKTQNLAERFAYGLFMCRPLHLKTIKMKYLQDRNATLTIKITPETEEELKEMEDISQTAQWIKSGAEDFFHCSN